MVDHYGADLNDYILSMLSMTSNLFSGSNLKESINIAVTSITTLSFDPTEGADRAGTKSGGKNCLNFKKTALETGDIFFNEF